MIEELLKVSSGRLLIPIVVVVVGAAFVRGIFGLHRSRSADRRDFLDAFRGWEGQEDLWLSTAVRHLFGAYLPPSLIRQLMSGPQPGRALLEVSTAWNFIDMDDETAELRWRWSPLGNPTFRKSLGVILTGLYFILGCAAVYLAYLSLTGTFGERAAVVAWTYVGLGLIGAFACLNYKENLSMATKAAKRWLGLP